MVSSGETMMGGNGDAMGDEVMDMMDEEGDDSQKAAAALIGLVWLMTSKAVSDDAKASACGALAALAADRRPNKDRIAGTDGALLALVRCAARGGDKTRANAALALGNLVDDHIANKSLVSQLPGFFPALASLLRTGTDKTRWHAARLAASMAMLPHLKESIGGTEDTVQELVRLARQGDDEAASSAACALANVSDSHPKNWERIAAAQRSFSTLVDLAGAGSSDTRSHAVRAIANLSVSALNKSRIVRTPRALNVLVGVLESDRGSGRSNAAAALGNLAHDHDENKTLITQQRGALSALVASLTEGTDDSRRNAAAALANLADSHTPNMRAIAHTRGAIESLTQCVWEGRDDVCNNACCCLATLCVGIRENQTLVAMTEGTLLALVDAARRGGDDTVTNACGALANVCENHAENKKLLGTTGDAIPVLVKVACNARTEVAITNAVCALSNLAADNPLNKARISGTPGALQVLVQLVASSTPETRSNAACAIANLLADEEGTKEIYADIPHAFGCLVEQVGSGTQAGKENAARALANATHKNDRNKTAVSAARSGISSLVALAQSQIESARAVALHALANLCDSHMKNMSIVAQEPFALEAVIAVAMRDSSDGQRHAIRAIANMSELHANRVIMFDKHDCIAALLKGVRTVDDGIRTTSAFALAKLTDRCTGNAQKLADHEGSLIDLAACVQGGSKRSRGNAAVCICHLTSGRHEVAARLVATEGAVKALSDAAGEVIERPELDDPIPEYHDVESRTEVLALETAEWIVQEREQKGRGTEDVEAAEDARRSCSFAIASLGACRGPEWRAVQKICRVRGVLSALVWTLNSQATDPDRLVLDLDESAIEGADEEGGGEELWGEHQLGQQPDGAVDFEQGSRKRRAVQPRVDAVKTLANLADDDQGNCVAIVRSEGCLGALTAAMTQTQWPHLRTNAARVVANLSHCHAARGYLAESPGLIVALVGLMEGSADSTSSQPMYAHAARALANLAANHSGNKQRIISTHLCIPLMVKIMTFGAPEARANCSRALGNLADNSNTNAAAIADTPGALDAVILVLRSGLDQVVDEEWRWRGHQPPPPAPPPYMRDTCDVEPFMLVEGAHILVHLANSERVRAKIAARPGVLELLTRGAYVDYPAARTNSVRALANLACNNAQIAHTIAGFPGAIAVLIRICEGSGEGYSDEARSASIRALVNIVDAADGSKPTITSLPNGLHAVVAVIFKGSEAAKGNACYLVANLAEFNQEVSQRICAIAEAVPGLVGIVHSGTDFARSNASRALGNLVNGSTELKKQVLESEGVLQGLVAVAQEGKDKSRGNACLAIGNMCDEGDARSIMDRELVRQHKSMLIDLDGAMWALVRTAVECGPDVALQACRAIATVIWGHKGAKEELCGLEGALDQIIEIAATRGVKAKAVAWACSVVANAADVEGCSARLIVKIASSNQVLETMINVVLDQEMQSRDPKAVCEAARALANVSEPLSAREDEEEVEAAMRHDGDKHMPGGVPPQELRGWILAVEGSTRALVKACVDGSDEAKEHAARCMAHISGGGNNFSGILCREKGTVASLVSLCRFGTDTAIKHASLALCNLASLELAAYEALLEGVYAIRDRVQEALTPPKIVAARIIVQGMQNLAEKNAKGICRAFSTILQVPLTNIEARKAGLYGTTSVLVDVTVEIERNLSSTVTAESAMETMIDAFASGEMFTAMENEAVRTSRVTLHSNPSITSKDVISNLHSAPPPPDGSPDEARTRIEALDNEETRVTLAPLATSSATAESLGEQGAAKLSGLAEIRAVLDNLRHMTEPKKIQHARDRAFLRLLTNRDIARALMKGGVLGDVDVTWRQLCALSSDLSNVEEVYAQRLEEGEEAFAALEASDPYDKEDYGIARMRRISSQTTDFFDPYTVMPRATFMCETPSLIETLLSIASGAARRDETAENPPFVKAKHSSSDALCRLAGVPAPVPGALPPLPPLEAALRATVDLLRWGSIITMEYAAVALLNLSMTDTSFVQLVATPRNLDAVSRVLDVGSFKGKLTCSALITCLASSTHCGRFFCQTDFLISRIVQLGEIEDELEAREASSMALSVLAGDPENSQAIISVPRSVTMLGLGMSHHSTSLGGTAIRALCQLHLSDPIPDRGNIAHAIPSWGIKSTQLTSELVECPGAVEGVIQCLLDGPPQRRNDAAIVLVMLTGEPVAMRLLAQTPGTFSILIEMLGLASLSASESAATILYRQSLEVKHRSELGATLNCLDELTSVLDGGSAHAQAMAGCALINLIDNSDNQARLCDNSNIINILLRCAEESDNAMTKRCAIGVLRQVVDGVGGFKAMRIKRRVDTLKFR